MDIIQRIAHLQVERAEIVARKMELETILRDIKSRQANAPNLTYQNRLDTEHRRTMRLLSEQETAIVRINARIALLHAQRQAGNPDRREVA